MLTLSPSVNIYLAAAQSTIAIMPSPALSGVERRAERHFEGSPETTCPSDGTTRCVHRASWPVTLRPPPRRREPSAPRRLGRPSIFLAPSSRGIVLGLMKLP